MPDTTRRLVLIRHARAEDGGGKPDHDRSLTDSGRRDARALGTWLRSMGISPDAVACSTSARTRETWAAIVDAGAFGSLVDHDQRVYNADVSTLLEVVREFEPSAKVAVIVGHAPGIPGLAATLNGPGTPDADADAQEALQSGYPTATAAIVDLPTAWADAAPEAGRLVAVHTGRHTE